MFSIFHQNLFTEFVMNFMTPWHLVYVNGTSSTTCHGCHKKYRQTEPGKLTCPLNDMILGIRMHSVYHVKGTSQSRVTKDTKENCYFHIRKTCNERKLVLTCSCFFGKFLSISAYSWVCSFIWPLFYFESGNIRPRIVLELFLFFSFWV